MSQAPAPHAPKPDRVELRVARLVKAHGLKGGLKLEVYTDDPQLRFIAGNVFRLQVPQDSQWFGKTLALASVREVNSSPVAFFEGIDSREQAETLVKAILWIDHDPSLRPTEKNAWFDHELVGLSVLRDGVEYGVVARVDHLPSQDLLVVSRAGEEVLLPFVEAFVPSVDLAGGTITITPPGGLFETIEDAE